MKVLIIRFSSIGDIVLTTPIIRTVKKQLGPTVHFATFEHFKGLVANNPYIDKIFTLDEDIKALIDSLRQESYDLIIDLHKNIRTRRIIRSLKVKIVTFDKVNIAKWMLVNLKIDKLPNKHIVDRYFDAVSSIGVRNDGLGLDYFLPTDIVNTVKSSPIMNDLRSIDNYTVIVLGATFYTKRMPEQLLNKFINSIAEPIVLIGGSDVVALALRLLKANPDQRILDYCGQVNIDFSAYIMLKSQKIITGDTGMMHIAAALQKPIISVWGNTTPKFGMYPYYGSQEDKNTSLEVQYLSCRPCSKLGFNKCPKGHFKCMDHNSLSGSPD